MCGIESLASSFHCTFFRLLCYLATEMMRSCWRTLLRSTAIRGAELSLRKSWNGSPAIRQFAHSPKPSNGSDPRGQVLKILQSIEASSGSFCTSGVCQPEMTVPGLLVDGIGPIAVPLTDTTAKALVERCEKAPFGKGSEKIVDVEYRNTWQLPPQAVQTTHPSWSTYVKHLAAKACEELGVARSQSIKANFYKMLVYEEGGFFKIHRDSEKENGMFGTLVVVLPSDFDGGELVIKHLGKTQRIKQDDANVAPFSSQYLAFYADCEHELLPVTRGHRLCLVYNLVKDCGSSPKPSSTECHAKLPELKAAASAWGENFCGRKLVIMAEHLYTPSGRNSLKGKDAVLRELLELGLEAGIDLEYARGKVHLLEEGLASVMSEEDALGARDEDRPSDFDWDELLTSDLKLDLDDHGPVRLYAKEMVPVDYFQTREPDDIQYGYHEDEPTEAGREYCDREAIVVWPRSRRTEVLVRPPPEGQGKRVERWICCYCRP